MDKTPLSAYTDEELIREVLRREITLERFTSAILSPQDPSLRTIVKLMERPWERGRILREAGVDKEN